MLPQNILCMRAGQTCVLEIDVCVRFTQNNADFPSPCTVPSDTSACNRLASPLTLLLCENSTSHQPQACMLEAQKQSLTETNPINGHNKFPYCRSTVKAVQSGVTRVHRSDAEHTIKPERGFVNHRPGPACARAAICFGCTGHTAKVCQTTKDLSELPAFFACRLPEDARVSEHCTTSAAHARVPR